MQVMRQIIYKTCIHFYNTIQYIHICALEPLWNVFAQPREVFIMGVSRLQLNIFGTSPSLVALPVT